MCIYKPECHCDLISEMCYRFQSWMSTETTLPTPPATSTQTYEWVNIHHTTSLTHVIHISVTMRTIQTYCTQPHNYYSRAGSATEHLHHAITELHSACCTLHKIFWAFTRCRFLVCDQHLGTTCLSRLQGLRGPFPQDPEDGTDKWSRNVGYTPKKGRRVKTQMILCNMTTMAEAFNHIHSACLQSWTLVNQQSLMKLTVELEIHESNAEEKSITLEKE
jgi:hypothetical protein